MWGSVCLSWDHWLFRWLQQRLPSLQFIVVNDRARPRGLLMELCRTSRDRAIFALVAASSFSQSPALCVLWLYCIPELRRYISLAERSVPALVVFSTSTLHCISIIDSTTRLLSCRSPTRGAANCVPHSPRKIDSISNCHTLLPILLLRSRVPSTMIVHSREKHVG